ncbi:hypothetical protein, partial [Flavonifractor sp.]|uniref:hypothetical protein n=1 Tax=Flavonifractor sp. TaxID=2049025 RepID=UPI00308091F6
RPKTGFPTTFPTPFFLWKPCNTRLPALRDNIILTQKGVIWQVYLKIRKRQILGFDAFDKNE